MDTPSALLLRVDRLEALFEATPFCLERPHLDPGPALDHLVKRLRVGGGPTSGRLRVEVATQLITPELVTLATAAQRIYCRERAEQRRAEVQAIRRAGRSAMGLGVGLLALALGSSVVLNHFEPLPRLFNTLISEALVIAGWVVLWRPLDLLLFEWIIPQRDARTFAQLAELPLDVVAAGSSDVRGAARTTIAGNVVMG